MKITGKVSDKEYLKMMKKEEKMAISATYGDPVFEKWSGSIDLSDKVSEWEKEMAEDAVIPEPPVKRVSQETFMKNLRELEN